MGLSGNIESEMEIKSPVNEFFQALIDNGNLYHKAFPHASHKHEVHEGDGKSLGSVNSFHFVLEGDTVLNCKTRVEAIDEENKSLILNVYDGDVGKLYNKYILHMQIVTKDDKDLMKWSIEYEKANEAVPPPTKFLSFVGKYLEGLDSHALQVQA